MHKFEEKGKKAEKKQSTAQNRTGIPTQMKIRLEQSTGYSLDDIRIHYNSDKPGQLDALAYTQGNQIYIGPGQERHLPHELGHAVQQKMGIVSPNTRHHSGVAMNTAAALERSADEIGAGQTVVQNKALPQQAVVQRMSVFEGETQNKDMYHFPDKSLHEASKMPIYDPKKRQIEQQQGHKQEVAIPVVRRYKREGWHIQNELTDYFPEEEIKKMTIVSPKDFLEKAGKTQSDLKSEEDKEKATETLQNFLQTNLGTRIPEKRLEQKPPADILSEIQDQINRACQLFPPQEEKISFGELEKKGEYLSVKPVADMSPYYNHKKMAMFCIAQMATKISDKDCQKDVGPHIAITVLGHKIYVAINTSFSGHSGKEPADSRELVLRVRKAITCISNGRTDLIQGIINGKETHYTVSKTEFETRETAVKEMNAELIQQWIQKIAGYDIIALDVPKSEMEPRGGAIHGEMTIADYLQSAAKSTSGASYEKATLERRNAKLRDIAAGEQNRKQQRVIWFGGTRFDCAKCHGHFQEIKDKIENNYVISSLNTGARFKGTESGTNPESKGLEGKAAVAVFEVSKESLQRVIADLNELKKKIAERKTKDAAASVLSREEIELLHFSEQFLKAVPSGTSDTAAHNACIGELASTIECIKKSAGVSV